MIDGFGAFVCKSEHRKPSYFQQCSVSFFLTRKYFLIHSPSSSGFQKAKSDIVWLVQFCPLASNTKPGTLCSPLWYEDFRGNQEGKCTPSGDIAEVEKVIMVKLWLQRMMFLVNSACYKLQFGTVPLCLCNRIIVTLTSHMRPSLDQMLG